MNRGVAFPFLLIAPPLGVEFGGRWAVLAASLVLVGGAVVASDGSPSP